MNYRKTADLISALNEIETFSRSGQRHTQASDWDKALEAERWVAEAKETIFNLFKEIEGANQ